MTVQDSIQLTCRVSRSYVPQEQESEVVLLASLQAVKANADENRNSVDIVVVLDRSYSMLDGEKLELCKRTLGFMCREILTERDRLGLVVFDSNVQVAFPCELMTDVNKDRFLAKLNAIQVGDHTNLSAGLFQGLETLMAVNDRSDVSAVLLLSDGEMTSGVMNREKLQRMTSNIIASFPSETKPTVHCFGYGDTYDEVLVNLAQENGGTFYHVATVEHVPLAFADTLGGLLHVAAQNVIIHVEVSGGGAELQESELTKCGRIEKLSGCSWNLHIRDIYIGERKDVLIKVRLPGILTTFSSISCAVRVRYIDVIKETPVTLDSDVQIQHLHPKDLGDLERFAAEEDPEVKRHMIRVGVANALNHARLTAKLGNFAASTESIQGTLHEATNAMKAMNLDESSDLMLKDVLTDLRQAEHIYQTAAAETKRKVTFAKSAEAKVLESAAWGHANQRANVINVLSAKSGEVAESSTSSYNVEGKVNMVSKAKQAFRLF